MATVQSADLVKVITVRATGFDAAVQGGSEQIETQAATADSGQSKFVKSEIAKSERPDPMILGELFPWSPGISIWEVNMSRVIQGQDRPQAIKKPFSPDLETIADFRLDTSPGFRNVCQRFNAF